MAWIDLENTRILTVALNVVSSAFGIAEHRIGTAVTSCLAVALITVTHVGPRLSVTHWRPHWRTIPCTISTVTLAVLSIADKPLVATSSLQVVVSCFTALILWMLPVPRAGKLQGPYKSIGTTGWNISVALDDSNNATKTTIPVQCWFPCTPHSFSTKRAMLWTSGMPGEERGEMDLLLNRMPFGEVPTWLFRHLSLALTNSVWIDPQSAAEYLLPIDGTTKKRRPVAIYSHGKFGWRQIDHRMCEAMASYGFVVIATEHYPDAMVTRPLGKITDASTANFDWEVNSPKGMEERLFYICGADRRARQVSAAIESLQTNKIFKDGSLCFDKMVAWGHSYGAATAATIAARDSRIRAVALLDSWMYPVPDKERKCGTSAKVLSLSSEHWSLGHYQVPFRKDFIAHAGLGSTDYVMLGTSHQNFAETVLLANQRVMPKGDMLGSVNATSTYERIQKLITTFFYMTDESDLPKMIKSEQDGLLNTHSATPVDGAQDSLLNMILTCGPFRESERMEIKSILCHIDLMPENYIDNRYAELVN